MIYHEGGHASLAPFYDLICTIYYPELSHEMAMKLGDEYHSELVTPNNFDALAEQAALSKPLVRERVAGMATEILDKIKTVSHKHHISKAVTSIIKKRCESTASAFK
jgi:serine/threonine-protein kinase HipA